MRGVLLLLSLVAACTSTTTYTDAGPPGDGGDVDAKFEIDAQVFECDAQACGEADACCPSACHANNDPDCPAVCDNAVLETGELCDPLSSCPSACAAVGCQLRALDGAACTATCIDAGLETTCQDGDGCCPSVCNATNDAECAAVCDNGVIESGEQCDPLASCPDACPQVGCALRTLFNASSCQAQCVVTGQVGACTSGDGCCPAGCNNNNDTDCDPFCGNSVVEAGEGCDGNCPTCGVETFSCFGQTGSAATCDTQCHQPALECGSGDGCCPYQADTGGDRCNRDGDGECNGTGWRSVYFGSFAYAPCRTVNIYGLERNDSVLFTTCSPTGGADSIGDTMITRIFSTDWNGLETFDYFPGLSPINDDTTDPYALPLLAGWDCRNSAGSQYMSTAPQNDGGVILRGTPNRVEVTFCHYGFSGEGRAPFHVWWNGAGSPNPG